MHAPFAEKYRANRAERRNQVEAELKAIAEALTPEQREKARHYIEGRMVHAPVVESVAERLRTAADKLGLTQEQRSKIREAHAGFAEKYDAQRDQRRGLRREELKAMGAVLTPEQLEKVKSYLEDRIE